ncbi:VC1465 family Xer recombination activation factor [Xanthomonas campestris pv. incanae]|uniref:VC1465 family Xer recombination activation factor n=1 Tax=Xanthomonas campestris TaxID=339 RepID=UPI003D05DC0A
MQSARSRSGAKRLYKSPHRSIISNTQFRDARIFGGFTREEAARFLNVSVRTIGHWETGRVRPTYAAFKLLRIYRHGDLIHPAWADCSISHRGALVTPEGHEIKPADLAWLSLLFRRAEAMGSLLRERDQLRHRLQQIDQASAGEAGPRPWACLFLNK